jgi:hypothetical protein
LLTDWDKMYNRHRQLSIDASYQDSVHFTKGFQRRRLKCDKLTDDGRYTTKDGRQTPRYGKSSTCLWQGEPQKVSKLTVHTY